MKIIAYYITGYGYGHASRSIAIIRRLLNHDAGIKIHICSSFPTPFLQASLNNYQDRLSFRNDYAEFEYVLRPNSMEPDTEKIRKEYRQFMNQSHSIIERERMFLLLYQVELVLTDICVFPIPAARQAGIPVIGVSNFTWYTAYSKLMSKEELHPIYDMYRLLDGFVALAGANEPPWGRHLNKEIGFFNRETSTKEIRRIRERIDPNGDKYIVFVGMGMKVSHEDCQAWRLWDDPNVRFIVSSHLEINKENVYRIPSHVIETQNYIAAADAVVTKAGWGIISEAVACGTQLILTERSGMQEDDNTLGYLHRYHEFSTVPWESLEQFSFSALPLHTSSPQETDISKGKYGSSLDELSTWIVDKLNSSRMEVME